MDKVDRAIGRSITHDEIVSIELTEEEIETMLPDGDDSVDLVHQYGYIDIWGTIDDEESPHHGADWRLYVHPVIQGDK